MRTFQEFECVETQEFIGGGLFRSKSLLEAYISWVHAFQLWLFILLPCILCGPEMHAPLDIASPPISLQAQL